MNYFIVILCYSREIPEHFIICSLISFNMFYNYFKNWERNVLNIKRIQIKHKFNNLYYPGKCPFTSLGTCIQISIYTFFTQINLSVFKINHCNSAIFG